MSIRFWLRPLLMLLGNASVSVSELPGGLNAQAQSRYRTGEPIVFLGLRRGRLLTCRRSCHMAAVACFRDDAQNLEF